MADLFLLSEAQMGRLSLHCFEFDAFLLGALRTILEWTERQAVGRAAKNKTPGGVRAGVLVLVVAGAGFEPAAFRL
jgi:site-specific DNA recombinase